MGIDGILVCMAGYGRVMKKLKTIAPVSQKAGSQRESPEPTLEKLSVCTIEQRHYVLRANDRARLIQGTRHPAICAGSR